MARMSIDDRFLRDPRVVRLANAMGWNKYEARGRLLEVYAIAYDMVDAGHEAVLQADDIDIAASSEGLAKQMLAMDLAVEIEPGKFYIRGAKHVTEYLVDKREAGRLGGIKSGESRRNQNA